MVASSKHIPWTGFAAIILFVVGFVLPLLIEYRRLGSGFREIELTYRANRHHDLNPPHEEVFAPQQAGPAQAGPAQARHRSPTPIIIACAVIAIFLLGFDIIEVTVNQSNIAAPNDTISNY